MSAKSGLFPNPASLPHKQTSLLVKCAKGVCLHGQVVEACMARLQEQAMSVGMEGSTSLQFSIPGGPTWLEHSTACRGEGSFICMPPLHIACQFDCVLVGQCDPARQYFSTAGASDTGCIYLLLFLLSCRTRVSYFT